MKNSKKKVLSVGLASLILSTSVFSARTSALDWKMVMPNVVGSVVVSSIPKILEKIYDAATSNYDRFMTYRDVEKHKGFRAPQEIMNKLDDIVKNKSEIKIYGQEKAKSQMVDALSSVVTRIDNIKRHKSDVKEIRGNIAYLIGRPGVGKTKMCYAIADAFLKHPEKSSIFLHSESITDESTLGNQLFKTVGAKDIGERHKKNIFTGSDGIVAKEEESPMLKHLLNWYDSVVIIDEYEKMKQQSAKPGTTMMMGGMSIPIAGAQATAPKCDNSADEVIRSIASTGKYKFMNKEIDCSRTLFLITTNETKEELEQNFGIGGVKGGGAQRLNIIEFDDLTIDACRGIVNDLVETVSNVLTDKQGSFKVKSVTFDKESLEAMANYIFNDKIMQGRAKNKLEDKIYSMFSKNIGKDANKKIQITFDKSNSTFSYK